jgi:hypothetical protein
MSFNGGQSACEAPRRYASRGAEKPRPTAMAECNETQQCQPFEREGFASQEEVAMSRKRYTLQLSLVTRPPFRTTASERVYIKLSAVDRLWFCALEIMRCSLGLRASPAV